MKDLKYLIAYIGPLFGALGLYHGGYFSLGITFIAFGIIPLLELVLPYSIENHEAVEEESRSNIRYFDFLLYLHVPLLYLMLFWAYFRIQSGELTTIETIATTFNIGIMIGVFGINVAHELGHREKGYERFFAKALLLPAHYMHFIIEHNFGHHKHVATPLDPATSRKGENLYAFWVRSTRDSYLSGWAIETDRLKREGKSFWSLNNQMLVFQAIQVVFLSAIGLYFSWQTLVFAIVSGVIGFLLLETVNYIEHYGLERKKLPNGRYEAVLPKHSWNSDYEIGRVFLYELTRHSDHHYKATRKYQILRHFDESPQLPFGYPMCMMISLIPPLWFNLMDKKVAEHEAIQPQLA